MSAPKISRKGDHDDGHDALEMALHLASELLEEPDDDGLGDRLPISVI